MIHATCLELLAVGHAILDLISPNPTHLLALGEPVLPLKSILADLLALGHAALSWLPVRPHLLALSHSGLRLMSWLLALGAHLDVLLALGAHLHVLRALGPFNRSETLLALHPRLLE